jgi:hypothetical protein
MTSTWHLSCRAWIATHDPGQIMYQLDEWLVHLVYNCVWTNYWSTRGFTFGVRWSFRTIADADMLSRANWEQYRRKDARRHTRWSLLSFLVLCSLKSLFSSGFIQTSDDNNTTKISLASLAVKLRRTWLKNPRSAVLQLPYQIGYQGIKSQNSNCGLSQCNTSTTWAYFGAGRLKIG